MPQIPSTAGVQVVTATPRQLESLIRLSEAQARMHLRETVIEADVDEALRLMKVGILSCITTALQQSRDHEAYCC